MQKESYIGKINLGGELFQLDTQKHLLRGYPENGKEIPLANFAPFGDSLCGYLIKGAGKVIAGSEGVSSLNPWEYTKVFLPIKLLERISQASAEEIGFHNDLGRLANMNALVIDAKLDRVLRGLPPLYLIGGQEYVYNSAHRSFDPAKGEGQPIGLPANTGLSFNGKDYFHYDGQHTLREIIPFDSRFPEEAYILPVPAQPDPFADARKGWADMDKLLGQMLEIELPQSQLNLIPREQMSLLIAEWSKINNQPVLDKARIRGLQQAGQEAFKPDMDKVFRAWFAEGGFSHQIILGPRMFHADFSQQLFIDNLKPENRIPFGAFEPKGKNQGRIFMDAESGRLIAYPTLMHSAFAVEVSIPLGVLEKTTWENPGELRNLNRKHLGDNFYLADELLFDRLIAGRKPVITMVGDRWEVDGSRGELTLMGNPWIRMDDDELYSEGTEEEFTIVYNTRTKRDDGLELENGTALREEWRVLKCPPFYKLDPVGYAAAEAKNPLELISRYGLEAQREARQVDIDQTDIRAIIDENRKSAGLPPLKKEKKAHKYKGSKKQKGR